MRTRKNSVCSTTGSGPFVKLAFIPIQTIKRPESLRFGALLYSILYSYAADTPLVILKGVIVA